MVMFKKMILIIGSLYTATSLASDNLEFENKTLNQNSTNPKYVIQTNYPQILQPHTPAEISFNQKAKEWAQASINEFKKSVADNESYPISADLKANGSTLTVTYDLTALEPRKFISLRYSTDRYLAGAAHPAHTYAALNYDLDRNQVLTLQDLFNPNSPYLRFLSKTMTTRLTQKLNKEANGGGATLFKDGLTPDNKNYEVWNITPRGLKFTFNEYQVAAYVFGPQEIVLKYPEVQSYLAKDTILRSCLDNHSCQIKTYLPSPKTPSNTTGRTNQ